MKLALIIPIVFVLLQLATCQDNDNANESNDDMSGPPHRVGGHRHCHGPPPPGRRPSGPPPDEDFDDDDDNQNNTRKRSVNRRNAPSMNEDDMQSGMQGGMQGGMHGGMQGGMGGMGGDMGGGMGGDMGGGMGGGTQSGRQNSPPSRNRKRDTGEIRSFYRFENNRAFRKRRTTIPNNIIEQPQEY
ncbi:circumsporozoite protein-like [Vespa crabro]|uniref:circumsporozoite protein-like n=1 Tax=Vespa crabro TaxID=7445 RepID=UPI001F01CC98|nr:circumsporozoite protein-like [Vespa crabro]